ncbi:MAG: hypothetical protein ACI9DO_001196 [Reinekea sp.]
MTSDKKKPKDRIALWRRATNLAIVNHSITHKGAFTMPKTELKSLFQRLREKLPESEASSTQQLLLAKIQYHIHEEGEENPEEPSLRESVEILLDEIEAEHPKSAAIAKNILETLASIGI